PGPEQAQPQAQHRDQQRPDQQPPPVAGDAALHVPGGQGDAHPGQHGEQRRGAAGDQLEEGVDTTGGPRIPGRDQVGGEHAEQGQRTGDVDGDDPAAPRGGRSHRGRGARHVHSRTRAAVTAASATTTRNGARSTSSTTATPTPAARASRVGAPSARKPWVMISELSSATVSNGTTRSIHGTSSTRSGTR